MLSVKKLPWLSFTLLLASYTSFGWYLSVSHLPKVVWIFAFAWAFFLDAALMAPITQGSRLIAKWFQSDTVTFLTLFSGATAIAILLFWLQIFTYILLIVAAEALARVDAQTAGFNQPQTFWLLAMTSLMGLALGWTINQALVAIP